MTKSEKHIKVSLLGCGKMWDDKSPQGHRKRECLMVNIITARENIGQILSGVPQERLAEIRSGVEMEGNQSKTTNFAELKQRFRTAYGIFTKVEWDEEAVSQSAVDGVVSEKCRIVTGEK